MISVTYPGVSESFKRALDDVVRPYIGANYTIGGIPVDVADADIVYDLHYLSSPRQKPIIVFANASPFNLKEWKTTIDGTDQGIEGIEQRFDMTADIFVAASAANANDKAQGRLPVTKLFDVVCAILNSQSPALLQRGIFNMHIPPMARDFPADQYVVVSGQLKCGVSVIYRKDDPGVDTGGRYVTEDGGGFYVPD